MTSSKPGSGALRDMAMFQAIFFEEVDEHIASMETILVRLDGGAASPDDLNAVFRAVHSIKGSAGMLGYAEIVAVTHEFENLLDSLRRGVRALEPRDVSVMLRAGDLIKAQVAVRRDPAAGAPEGGTVLAELRTLAQEAAERPAQRFSVALGPLAAPIEADALRTMFAGLRELGSVDEGACRNEPGGTIEFSLSFGGTESDLNGILALVVPPDLVRVSAESNGAAAGASTPDARVAIEAPNEPAAKASEASSPEAPAAIEVLNELPARAPAAIEVLNEPPARAPATQAPAAVPVFELFQEPSGRRREAGRREADRTQPTLADASSIRVGVEKVDQLINLVGELVITQAMLAQTASKSDPVLYESLFNGLGQLERNTRDLQEAAMSIRMMPMSFVFSRFPRVVRDVAAKLGKEVELHTVGEGTELDKGLIERIVDPLTHLVRNSLDHGLESPEERVAKGKVRKGTITMRAYHQGGAIVIEVADDGRGLRREKILAKAKERGMPVSDAMSDQEVWALIFEAGFSTAEVVTDVSGRGVGMDVVRRNIQEMGGRVEIESQADIGTRISIKLPLTLAILDGMSVRVGGEIFIIPLSYISESLQPKPGAVSSVAGQGLVVSVRGDYLPIMSLAQTFGMQAEKKRAEDGVLVILENESRRTALFVDELVAQHQVVIKSLETNFRKVPGVSGATIMGDGRVAMILDVTHFTALAHNRLRAAA